MSNQSSTDGSIETVHYDDNEPTVGNRIPSDSVDTDDVYDAKYDIELGTTVVADQSDGTQQVMWRAEIVWTEDGVDHSGEQYLAEHPAEAVLGLFEQLQEGDV